MTLEERDSVIHLSIILLSPASSIRKAMRDEVLQVWFDEVQGMWICLITPSLFVSHTDTFPTTYQGQCLSPPPDSQKHFHFSSSWERSVSSLLTAPTAHLSIISVRPSSAVLISACSYFTPQLWFDWSLSQTCLSLFWLFENDWVSCPLVVSLKQVQCC